MCNVVLNNELKGVELYFEDKPAKSIRDSLKANGFRYHGGKVCWFARQSEKTLKVAQELSEQKTLPQVETNTETKQEVKNKITRKPKQEKLSLWDATRWSDLEVNNKQDAKIMAAEMRKHVRVRFPMVKFSVRSTYSRIDFDITASPFEKDSVYLIAVREYCNKLIGAYRYCTCYDPYGDYGSSYNFYGSNCDISYDYKQTDLTEELKTDMLDFDQKLVEFEKAEEERKEKEYQEYQKEQEEKEKQYQERMEQEKKEIEIINKSVKVIDLEENKKYFVIGSQFAHLNKNNTLDQYKEEVEKGEYSLENVKITKEVHFQSEEALEYFSNLLLKDFTWLEGTGGSYTDDVRINSMTDYYNMTEEERKTVIWTTVGVAIYFNNQLQYIVNPEGHSYARYVGLVDNVTTTKELNVKQLINHEQLQELKDKAESLVDLSSEVITCEPSLVSKWDNEEFNDYKNRMKQIFKKNNFKPTKTIIQQLPQEQERLKVAMYKILVEVDGVQDQFANADLQQGQKLTIFKISGMGSMTTSRITFDSVENTTYAQYKDVVKLTFKQERKRDLYYNHFYGDMLVYDGWLEFPETVLHEVKEENGMRITRTLFSSCDKAQYDKILEHFDQQGIKPIINSYKPMF